jgi:hypothetical protein
MRFKPLTQEKINWCQHEGLWLLVKKNINLKNQILQPLVHEIGTC